MVAHGAPARGRANRRLLARLLPIALALFASPTAAALESPIGAHSMLYLDTPLSAKDAMFREAAAVGASEIRLDIALPGVFPSQNGAPDWRGVDQYMALARRYRLRVLANLMGTPSEMTDCPPGSPPDLSYRCPPRNPAQWGQLTGLIAAHARGVIDDFEIINEPDGGWAFYGTPEQYAHILSASYHAIHRADPAARVALGGLMKVHSDAWIATMLGTPSTDAAHSFDIANIHVRTTTADAGPTVRNWRANLTANDFHGPLWVTETGYPADPAFQIDPGFQSGSQAQAQYLQAVIPIMVRAGAAKVFVTERDSLTGRFASEGFLQTTDPLTAFPHYTRRASFYAIQRLARDLSHPATLSAPHRDAVRRDAATRSACPRPSEPPSATRSSHHRSANDTS